MNETIALMRNLLKCQEQYANKILCNKVHCFLNLKMKRLKNRISKSTIKSKQFDNENERIDWLFNEIDNDVTLEKICKSFNKTMSLSVLQRYFMRQNIISKKYGYESFNEVIILRLKGIFGKNFDHISFSKAVVEECVKRNRECYLYNKTNDVINEENLVANLDRIDVKLKNLYIKMKNDKLIVDKNFTSFGALTLHFPITKKNIILIENLSQNTDYFVHELGHVVYNKTKNDDLRKVVCYDPCDEIVSSALEYLYICNEVKFNKNLINTYKEFLARTQILAINFVFLIEIGKIKNFTPENINKLWEATLDMLGVCIKTKSDLTFDNYFRLNMNVLEKIKYFIGKGVSILLKRKSKLTFNYISDNLAKSCVKNKLDFIEKLC